MCQCGYVNYSELLKSKGGRVGLVTGHPVYIAVVLVSEIVAVRPEVQSVRCRSVAKVRMRGRIGCGRGEREGN